METQDSVRPIGPDETFDFSCGPHVPCFNACCRDLNQSLTPYDVMHLARHLEMGTGDFLQAHTVCYQGPETGLPVVSLKPAGGSEKKCPFVTSGGCRVYEGRPGSCRMYPLARVLRRSRETRRLAESYVLICEAHCRGFEQVRPMTVRQWIADQGLAPYNEGNDAMIEVISAKQQHLPGPVEGELARKLFLALYDLDGFRGALSGSVAADCRRLGLDAGSMHSGDDSVLLGFAVAYAAEMLRHFPDSGKKQKSSGDAGSWN